MKVKHILKPVYTKDSKILILGTIPSPKSRELGFYYGHPQNRFWKILSELLNEKFPEEKEEKIKLVNKYNIALWDVLESCDINGASDSSIKNPKPNNINKILKETNIKKIFVTGKKPKVYIINFVIPKQIFLVYACPLLVLLIVQKVMNN